MAASMVLDPKLASSSPPATLPGPYSTVDAVLTDFEDDLYTRLKSLERQIELIEIQEEYVKDEQKKLKRELLRSQEEVKRIQSVSLVIGQFMEMIDQKMDLKSGVRIELTEVLEEMNADGDESVRVTVVPRVGCDDVTFEDIKIELIDISKKESK